MQLASLLKVAHTSDPWCLGSFPSPVGFQEEESLRLGCRKGARKGGGWRTRRRGKVVLSLSSQLGSRVQIRVYHV